MIIIVKNGKWIRIITRKLTIIIGRAIINSRGNKIHTIFKMQRKWYYRIWL